MTANSGHVLLGQYNVRMMPAQRVQVLQLIDPDSSNSLENQL
ncbi:MAG: hypothetical protein P8J91_09625 [Pirellulaceae bacterium]|nr:hypothetical protein [Pirellulaceae bacterium]